MIKLRQVHPDLQNEAMLDMHKLVVDKIDASKQLFKLEAEGALQTRNIVYVVQK